MRRWIITALLLLAATGAAQAQSARACQPPDETLLRARGGYGGRTELPYAEKIEQYNVQVRAFNSCSSGVVESNNNSIEQIRSAGNAEINALVDDANRRIRDIEEKIRRAIAGTAPEDAIARDEAIGFPAPDCRKPNRTALEPTTTRGRARNTISGGERFEALQRAYVTCARTYIGQGTSEIKQIADTANAQIRRTADEANGRIAQLRASSRAVIEAAAAAAEVEAKTVASTMLASNNAHGGLPVYENGVESVTIEGLKLRRSEDTPTGEGDPDEITCRTPQQLPDSRIPGPEICKRNRVWAALKQAGLTLGSDGRVTDRYEKVMDSRKNCTKVRVPTGFGSFMENEYCN